MTPGLFAGLAIAGLLTAALASVGAKVMRDFAGHELEEYCERRRRHNRFDEILDRHEQVALGAEILYIVGVAVFLLSGFLWLFRETDAINLWQVASALAIGIFILLITTIWIPWTMQRLWAVPLVYHSWKFWNVVSIVAWPLSVGVDVVDVLIRRMAGHPRTKEDEEEAFEDEIRTMVTTGQREGLIEADAREMIEGVIELGDTDVSDIMTPRSRIDAFEIGLGWNEVLQFAVRVGRTRIPVYKDKIDNIVGVLFVKDLLTEFSEPSGAGPRPIRELLRDAWFVPKTRPVDDLLQDFLNTRNHLAIVMDEYEAVAGVVTIEDVLEEIVGEIVDETDHEADEEISKIDETTAEARGSAHLDELNEQLGIDLPESDDYDTVAGLVLEHLGRVPKSGESIVEGNVKIAVLDASRRQIERVRIELIQK